MIYDTVYKQISTLIYDMQHNYPTDIRYVKPRGKTHTGLNTNSSNKDKDDIVTLYPSIDLTSRLPRVILLEHGPHIWTL